MTSPRGGALARAWSLARRGRPVDRRPARARAVAESFGVLGATAAAQAVLFVLTDSVALLADLIHNVGDSLTAVPLGIAFSLRSARGEKLAGLAVVLAIFVSACVALWWSIERLALELERADPLIGLGITLVILKITWDSWRTVRAR